MSETTTAPAAATESQPAPDKITPEFEKEYFETRGGEIEKPKAKQPVLRAPARKADPETVEAEPAATEEVTPAPEAKPESHIPPARLREEADKRRAAEAALAAAQAEHLRQMEVINQRLAALQQPAQPAQPEPTLETDPAAFIQHQAQKIEQIQQAEAQRQAQAQQMAYIHGLETRAKQEVQTFMAETPDYMDAESHLRDVRAKQLRLLNIPEQQIPMMIQMEALHIAEQAFQHGKPLGQTIYELAQSMGYARKAADPAPVTEQVDETEQKLANIVRGQRLSAGVPRGSAPPSGQISAERLLEMTPEEFDAFSRRAPARFKALMGGG